LPARVGLRTEFSPVLVAVVSKCQNERVPQFTDSYGVAIQYYEWPIPEPKAVIQLAHGIGEHAGRYQRLALALNAAGFSVYANDHRGHGATGVGQYGAGSAELGRPGPGGLRGAIAAVHEFSAIIREANPGRKLVLLGHSWGSLMSQILINEHSDEYDAVVLTGTAYRLPGWMDAGDLTRKHRPAPGQGSGFEWMTRDEAEQAKAVADPLVFDANVRKLLGTADALRLLGRPAKGIRVDLPILIMVGSDDILGGGRSAHKLAEAFRNRSGVHDVTVEVFEDARHEIFNETNRDEVTATLVSWLTARLA
jgi:alpha-beta hydrolase superfamily lysophospholipase